ncbi:MAG: hypothetical protein M1818_002768 [Claussenomyces sp. TS43310]|nr:MAG: hypothetical protein M1818_002768 [Claussenomyces sp. TS43310]
MSNFEVQFQDFGTFDTSAFLCIPAALHFRRVVCGGEHCVMAYCHDLVERGAHRMLEILGVGTAIMENAEGTLSKDIPMVNVRLPMHPIADPTERLVMLTWLWHYFVAKQRTRINVYFYDGAFWVRLSGQVYLELADFEWAAEVLKEVCHRVNAGEYKNLPERLRSDINKIKIEDE